MMDFLEKLFEQHVPRHPERHDDHGWQSARPPRDASQNDPTFAHSSEHASGGHQPYRGDPQGRSTLPGVLGALAQHKMLCVVAALVLLVVAIGGVLGLVLLLPLAGTILSLVRVQDLSILLTDLPRLISTLLVDVPKAVLDFLAPLLQLKNALDGKA